MHHTFNQALEDMTLRFLVQADPDLQAVANSTVSIDRDGTGGAFGFPQIATLNAITGLSDEEALRASGNILVGRGAGL